MQLLPILKILALVVSAYYLIKAFRKIKALTIDMLEIKKLSENVQAMALIGGWQLDLRSQKLTWTDQTYEIHDLPVGSPTELSTALEFYLGDDKKKLTAAIENCMQGVAFRETYAFRSAKAVEKWVEFAGQPIFDQNKKNFKLQGTLQDVTESMRFRIQAEQKHAETNTLKKQLSMILSHSPAAVYECQRNQNWTMQYMSSFIEKLSGYPASDFIHDQVRSYASIIHPEDVKYVEKTVTYAIENQNSFDLNYRIVTKSGEARPVWERGSFEASSGNLIGIIFDLTEQKKYEKLLDDSQRIAKLGNWTFHLATQEIEWSQQMYHLFPQEKELGPPSFEKHKSSIHPEDREMWQRTVQECARTGNSYKMRFRVIHPNHVLWIEAHGSVVRSTGGQILQLSGTCQDITETLILEETLNKQRIKNIQTTRLASLGEMSAGVAHEINNPLAIISGSIQLLQKNSFDQEKIAKKLGIMLKAADRISKIVNGLKKFARMSDTTEHQPRLLVDIVQDTLYILEKKALQTGARLDVINESESLVLCNNVEIEQVVINLVSNSLDAIKKQQEKWVQVKIYDSNQNVILQVEDSGFGVSPGIENKLFDPFFTTKSVGEGTGLGLSIVKGILDDHQAEISLNKSTPHTCFEIRFPFLSGKIKSAV